MQNSTTFDQQIADEYEANDVRVMTVDGDLVSYTEHGDDYVTAWTNFEEAVRALEEGHIAQLIVDDLIAAEHNPEYHGTAALDVAAYA